MNEPEGGTDPELLPPKEWLAAFEEKHGRPLRVLHFGNIANNAYNNAKVQRANGIEADVVAPDYYHVMGCPEWEDGEIDGQIRDAFYPDFWSVNMNGFVRPDWFVQGPAPLCRGYLRRRAENDAKGVRRYWRYLQAYRYSMVKPRLRSVVHRATAMRRLTLRFSSLATWRARHSLALANSLRLRSGSYAKKQAKRGLSSAKRKLPKRVLRRLETALQSEPASLAFHDPWQAPNAAGTPLSPQTAKPALSTKSVAALHDIAAGDQAETPELSEGLLPKPEFLAKHDVLESDFDSFHVNTALWMDIFEHYDIVQAYATDPIWPFLGQLKHYVAYEHGTIREIPFQDDPIGRLTKRAYLAAPAVFITNVDNIKAADKLGLTEEQRFYLPHAFDCTKLLRYAETCDVERVTTPDIQVFMPSRQHWVDGDPNWAKGNDLVIHAAQQLKARGYRPQIKFIEWGNDVEASKDLIRELGVGDLITWSPMLNKQQLWNEYLASTVVIDQFLLPGISGVSFEAMTLGRPVITHDEGDLNARFFGEAPPLLAASSPDAIADRIATLIDEPDKFDSISQTCGQWILDYHGPDRIFDIQVKGFQAVLGTDWAD